MTLTEISKDFMPRENAKMRYSLALNSNVSCFLLFFFTLLRYVECWWFSLGCFGFEASHVANYRVEVVVQALGCKSEVEK